jgi:uncharacterized membrane-anchored protein
MIQSKKALALALLFPIVSLGVLAASKKFGLTFGSEVVLPISGYDPRDLLSGHYIIYQIEYGVGGVCGGNSGKNAGYVCLEPKRFSYSEPSDCSKLIRGICNNDRFEAGVEKYFVPQEKAVFLDAQVRTKRASIVLSISSSGHAQVKDLLIDGQPWTEMD